MSGKVRQSSISAAIVSAMIIMRRANGSGRVGGVRLESMLTKKSK